MTDPASHPYIPSRAEREALNAALLATGTETGFWDDDGRPALWPDDISQWTPAIGEPADRGLGEQPF